MINRQDAKQASVKIVDSRKLLGEDKTALLEQLKALLPAIINSDNQLDSKALRDAVNIAGTTSNNQGYELTFAGKGLARAEADTPTECELKTERSQSKDFDETENVVIRGDNIDVLKILYQNYHGKIKMIYIDPPYNTKSDNFIYKDNFKQSDEDLIEKFSLDESTSDFLHNVYGTRSHSGWLSFMYPRLKLARELLAEDGVIFISIDDNEQVNLKILCDEIFGEENFLSDFPRVTKKGGKSSNFLSKNHDYILSYRKCDSGLLNRFIHVDSGFKHTDSFIEQRGKYKLNQTLDYDSIQYSPSLDYEIVIKGKIFRPGGVTKKEMEKRQKTNPRNAFCWRWSKNLFNFGFENDFVVVRDRIYTKTYLNATISKKDNSGEYFIEYRERDIAVSSIDFLDTKYSNDNAKKDLSRLFEKSVFENPKGSVLLKKLIDLGTKKGDTILDFFAGSGTTADAVMQLNAEDGGNRKFILVQWDEEIDKNKNAEAYNFCTDKKLDPVISSITIERLNRAGEKIKSELTEKTNKGHSLMKTKNCLTSVIKCSASMKNHD